ncbi:MAG TPA: hypothetical protein PK629_00670 [Oscillospiraceae bacterium]|nr:hypothetical protein [Oscillospiraceae bacterium]HPF55138.1 hypothetical protein [Clostridiales bacterium]HPK34544.1 hypothetical protein [Oscillospiraceae bacterium]HPR74772.1 hypothetical protein [Oscillospiraceae bacterium]
MTVFQNPFYLLGAAAQDDRWKISALADEKSISAGIDADAVTAARDVLTNPQKRLSAELRWFPGLGKEELAKLLFFFSELKDGHQSAVPGLVNPGILTALNLRLGAFPLWHFETDSELNQIILDINRLFESATVEAVKIEINRDRITAGISPVNDDSELKTALRNYRDEIRQTLHDKISALPQNRYFSLIAGLSAVNQSGGVLDDILTGYELYIMPEVKEQKQRIWTLISALKNESIPSEGTVNELSSALNRWNLLVRPLQAAAEKHGQRHPDSEEVTNAVRELTAELNSRGGIPEVLLPFTAVKNAVPEPQNAVQPGVTDSQNVPLIQPETDTQTQQESLYRNRIDRKYSVYLNADKVVIPPFCTCCMKPTSLVESVSASSSQKEGGKAATRTVSINMPVCPECLAHRKKAKWANWILFALSSLIGLASVLWFATLFSTAEIAFWLLPILVAAAAYVLLGLLLRLPKLGGEHSAMQNSAWIGGIHLQDNYILYTFTNWRYANLFAKSNAPQHADSNGEAPHVIEEPYRNRAKHRAFFQAAEYAVGIGALSLVFTAALLLIFGSKLTALSTAVFVAPTAAPASSVASSVPSSSLPASSIISSVPVSSAVSSSKTSSVRSSTSTSSKTSSVSKSSETTSSKPASSAPVSSVVTSSKVSSVRSSVTSSVRPSSVAASSKTSSVDYDALNEERRQEILLELDELRPQLNAIVNQLNVYESQLDTLWAKYEQTHDRSDYDEYQALYDEYLMYYEQVYLPLANEYEALLDEYESLNPKG